MEIHALQLQEFRGLDVQLDWKPCVVLFGANDVGKSNILEYAEFVLGGKVPTRTDPTRWHDEPMDYVVLFTLEHSIEGPDRELLAKLLQFGEARPKPLADPAEYVFGGEEVTLAPSREAVSLPALVAELRDYVLLDAQSECSDWPSIEEAYTALLDLCLDSRWFAESGLDGAHWCVGPAEERPPEAVAAARSVADAVGLWADPEDPHLLGPVARHLADGGTGVAPWLWFGDGSFGTVRMETVRFGGDVGRLLDDIEKFIIREWHQWTVEPDEPDESDEHNDRYRRLFRMTIDDGVDVWLEELDDDTYRIDPHVHEACRQISDKANEIAPDLVSSRAKIIVEPVEPMRWRANDGHRVHVLLERHDDRSPRDIRLAGEGMATWSAYAIWEAMRRISAEAATTRLYVLDEPEKHLHPLAQAEVAFWIGQLLREGASAVIATHSPALLDIPYGDVAHHGVVRRNGTTTTLPATSDLLGLVDELGRELGFGRGEFFQLTRAVLLVEGEHDKRVVQHYYGAELSRERIAIVPLRGHRNAPGLAEAQFLGDIGKTLLVLFDNTLRIKLDQALAGERPSRMSDEEKSAVRLVSEMKEAGRADVHVLPFDPPDIIAAFPEDVMTAAVERLGGRFPGYEQIRRSWHREGRGRNYKDYFMSACGIDAAPARLLDELLSDEGYRPLKGQLHEAIMEAIRLAGQPRNSRP